MKAVIFLIFVVSTLVILAGGKIFSISKIEVRLDKVNCADNKSLKNEITIAGENILLIDEKKLKNRLKEKFFCVADVKLTKFLPNKLGLDILGRKPAAIFAATPSGELKVVDEEGVVLGEENLPNLPRVFISGDKLDTVNSKKILRINEQLKDLGWTILNVKIDQGKNLFIAGTHKVYFNLEKDIDYQLASLQLILNQAKIETEKVDYIDLRFENPVIKER